MIEKLYSNLDLSSITVPALEEEVMEGVVPTEEAKLVAPESTPVLRKPCLS